MKDEYNQSSAVLSNALGLDYSGLSVNYIIKVITEDGINTNTSCRPTSSLRNSQPSQWNNGVKYTDSSNKSFYGYCATANNITVSDPNAEVIFQDVISGNKLFTKRNFGNGTAYYSNFFAGIAYLTKASIKYGADRPYGPTYTTQSFSSYLGDDELALMLAPYNQSGQQRTIVLSGDEDNSPNAIQTGVLSGTYAGKSYYLIPMVNFNQEVGLDGSSGSMIPRTLKVTVNVSDPSLVASVYSVKHGNLAFSIVSNAIEIDSFTLDDTDILKVEFSIPVPITPTPDPTPQYRASDINQDNQVNLLDLSILAQYWGQSSPGNARADINNDGVVNLLDLSLLASNWGT